jgi:fructoselysine-6-P-deglycase FrlB-like protein
MLTSYMNFVCDNADSLDLQITPKQAQKCAETYLTQSKTLSAFVKKTTFPRLFRTGSGSSEVVAAATEAQHQTRVD